MDRAVLAAMIDHTLLTPTATPDEVLAACAEAVELGAGAACVSPSRLPLPAGTLPGSMGLVAVVGFPSGAHRAATKAAEASLAVSRMTFITIGRGTAARTAARSVSTAFQSPAMAAPRSMTTSTSVAPSPVTGRPWRPTSPRSAPPCPDRSC